MVTERAYKPAACRAMLVSVNRAGDDPTTRQLVQPMLTSATTNGRTARWILRSCASTHPGLLFADRVRMDSPEAASHAKTSMSAIFSTADAAWRRKSIVSTQG